MKTDELLELAPYDGSENSERLFMEALKEELQFHYQNNQMYRRFCERKKFDPFGDFAMEDIPPVSVSVFKELGFKLNSVPEENLTLALQSSATSGIPSTILVDKETAKRQAKAMIKVVGEFIGKERKPFLIMDIDPRSSYRKLLGARFAAVTGYLKFANKTGYFLKADQNNVSYFDVDGIKEYAASLDPEKPVVVFGFTYILYQNVLQSIEEKGVKISLPKGSKIIHIGGWKKLESEKISKELFNSRLSACFGLEPSDVIDIYGFTEQMGLNYPDCTCGWKHTSSYVRVIVRDTRTREVLPPGKEGLLEFVSPVPHSYPGNAVLTDDIGVIDPESCPAGRAGTRFKVVGRMKKAEVRGCGDILSQKLTFQKKVKSSAEASEHLDVYLHKHPVTAETPLESLKQIIESLKSQRTWLEAQPVESIIGLIGAVAAKWASEPRLARIKDRGLSFLSSWCDAKHLASVSDMGLRGNRMYMDKFLPFPDSDRHFLRANSRGLVCHWLAGNVQILGMFALVQSIIAKNVNLLRVSSRDDGVFSDILECFEGVEYTNADGYTLRGDDLLKTIAVIYFNKEADRLGEEMSRQADVRIAWGGREAVETVSSYLSRYDAETVVFGPKLSYSVVAKEELSSAQEAKKLARKISVDVSVFDQTGCASPHNLYIEEGGVVSPEEFIDILGDSMAKTEIQIPKPLMSAEQISQIHSIRGVYDFKGTVKGSDTMSWTILLDDLDELDKPVYSRVLFVHKVKSIFDSLKYIDENTQTIGIAAPQDKALDFADKATKLGVMRLPLIGRMLNFEMPWDGIFLFDRLVRWNTYGGPLR
ncbi:MAG: acyl-CoA reductase [Bacteroidales bacterium]|nr:acyl-CoA reductase [Bacteroidales bacterium]